MKHAAKRLTVFLSIWMLLPLCFFAVRASSPTHYETKFNELSASYLAYNSKNHGAGLEVSRYITELTQHADDDDEVVSLICAKGQAVGPLALIYHSHPELHPDRSYTERPADPYEAVKYDVWQLYTAQKAIIDGVGVDEIDTFFADGGAVEDCYTAMLRGIYRSKLELIRMEEEAKGSDCLQAVLDIVGNESGGALRAISALVFETEDGENFASVFEEAAIPIAQHRARASAVADMKALVPLFYGTEADYFTLDKLADFRTGVENMTPVYPTDHHAVYPTVASYLTRLNTLVSDSITALLSDQKGTADQAFRNGYLDGRIAAVADRISLAQGEGTSALVADLFAEHPLLLARADTKDYIQSAFCRQIDEHASFYSLSDVEQLRAIAAEYTVSDGILDGCAHTADLELQIQKALLRGEWFHRLVSARQTIEGYEAIDTADQYETEFAELLLSIRSVYDDTDGILRDSAGGLEDDSAVSHGQLALADSTAHAEALAFLARHDRILQDTEITARDDKVDLLAAISHMGALQQSGTASHLWESIADLAIKYKQVLKEEISAALAGEEVNTLRADSQASLFSAVDALPFGSASQLAELPTLGAAAVQKAESIDCVLEHMTLEILSDPVHHYTSYRQEDKLSLSRACENGITEILEGTGTAEQSIVVLNRLEALAQIRLAAQGHEQVAGVSLAVRQAEEMMPALSEPSAIEDLADDTVFFIENLVSAHQMEDEIAALRRAVDGLTFLNTSQAEAFLTRISALQSHVELLRSADDADTDAGHASAARTDFSSARGELAYAIACMAAARSDYEGVLAEIRGLTYLSQAEKEVYLQAAVDGFALFLSTMQRPETDTSAEVNEADRILDEALQAAISAAKAADLTIAKQRAKDELADAASELTQILNEYAFIHAEARTSFLAKVEQLLSHGSLAIDGASDTPSVSPVKEYYLSVLRQTASEAAETERADCLASVKSSLSSAFSPDDYSSERQEELTAILQQYNEKLDMLSSPAEYVALREDALAQIRSVPTRLDEAKALAESMLTAAYEKLWAQSISYTEENQLKLEEIYTHTLGEIHLLSRIDDTDYALSLANERITLMKEIPLYKLYTEDGYLIPNGSALLLPDGYNPSDGNYYGSVEGKSGLPSDCRLSMTPISSADMESLIRQAAKKGSVLLGDGSPASDEILKFLKRCRISAAVNIDLGRELLPSSNTYKVSLLLPDGIDMANVVGVVYLCEDGSVEFYETVSEDMLLQFTANHFSDYYIISRVTVNLIPWIVALSILILCELVAVVLLLWSKRQKKDRVELFSVALLASPVNYLPAEAPIVLGILGIVALLLGLWIAYLLLEDRLRAALVEKEDTSYEEEEAFVPEGLPIADEEPIPETFCEVPFIQEPLTIVTAITVEEADASMSDKEACRDLIVDEENHEILWGTKRAELNLDTISLVFQGGDRVTLNTLKEKKLVANNVGFVKILGRGVLDKPLVIAAQDFSASALKMILLTGGTPILTPPSPERSGRKMVKIR